MENLCFPVKTTRIRRVGYSKKNKKNDHLFVLVEFECIKVKSFMERDEYPKPRIFQSRTRVLRTEFSRTRTTKMQIHIKRQKCENVTNDPWSRAIREKRQIKIVPFSWAYDRTVVPCVEKNRKTQMHRVSGPDQS